MIKSIHLLMILGLFLLSATIVEAHVSRSHSLFIIPISGTVTVPLNDTSSERVTLSGKLRVRILAMAGASGTINYVRVQAQLSKVSAVGDVSGLRYRAVGSSVTAFRSLTDPTAPLPVTAAYRIIRAGHYFRTPPNPCTPPSPCVKKVGTLNLPLNITFSMQETSVEGQQEWTASAPCLSVSGGPCIAPLSQLSLFAGDPANPWGYADGTGTAAIFAEPYGLATDSAGNVYVADSFNHLIRKITSAGVVTTLAGNQLYGNVDGTGTAARFFNPDGVATDSTGNVYVADTYNDSIRKVSPAGVVTTLAGSGVGGSADGTGTAASFYTPVGVATDNAGNVYVADTSNDTIRKITPAGVVTTLAGTAGVAGSADGTGAAATFNLPEGIATDSAGNIYVTDTANNIIRKISYITRTINPGWEVTTLAGIAGVAGSTDGTGAAATFNNPVGIAVDSTGNVYVADGLNDTIRKITPAGVVTTVVGQPDNAGFAPGPLPGLLTDPRGLALYGRTLYTTTNDEAIVKVTNLP